MDLQSEEIDLIYGFPLFVNPDDPGPVTDWIRRHKNWEPHVTEDLLPHLQKGKIFVDAGAHIGFFSLLASRQGCEVIAFEPDPLNFKFLQLNMGGRGTLIPYALWNSNREMILYRSPVNLGDHTLWKDGDGRKLTMVKTIRLDDSLHGRGLDVIKVDTQGAELVILESSIHLLRMWKPVIFLEYFPRGIRGLGGKPERLLEMLWDLGYELRDLLTKSRLTTIPDERNLVYLDLSAVPGNQPR